MDNGKYYQEITTMMTYEKAEEHCKNIGQNYFLANIQTLEDLNAIEKIVEGKKISAVRRIRLGILKAKYLEVDVISGFVVHKFELCFTREKFFWACISGC